jgi:hypothetical protein
VWPYQFDTTSIGLRGAVALLNVTTFPSYLLYKAELDVGRSNHRSSMSLGTSFTMLDVLISSVQDQLRTAEGQFKSLRFATKHNWIDCLLHYVASHTTETRRGGCIRSKQQKCSTGIIFIDMLNNWAIFDASSSTWIPPWRLDVQQHTG